MVFTLEGTDYYKKHLAIINPLLPVQMTNKEIEVIATFLEVESELGIYTFSSIGRKKIRSKLNLSHGGLSNYIRDLKLKEFLIETDGELSVQPILKAEPGAQFYQIKIINKK